MNEHANDTYAGSPGGPLSTYYEYNTLMRLLGVSVSKHLLDEHYTVIWANDFYYQLIGWSKDEYEDIFHNQCDLYYREDPEEWARLTATVVEARNTNQSGYSLISRIRRKDGQYIWVKFSTAFADEYVNGCQVAYTSITNIDDLVRIQKEQSVTYNNLPGFAAKFMVEGRDLQLLEANDRFRGFFGCDSLSCGLSNCMTEKNKLTFEQNLPLMQAGRSVHFTLEARNKEGNSVWLQVNGDCIDWVNGRPFYLIIYIDITDITEQKELQKQLEERSEMLKNALKEAERANRAKSDFLSSMSHDIRTPMNAIVGMTEIAFAHLNDPEKVGSCLKKISLSSQHLLGLINDVLDMSKIESGKMALRYDSMNLPEVMENVIAIVQPMLKSRKQLFSIQLKNIVHEQFSCDTLRLRQILINVLSNASKFTPSQGRITINIEEIPSETSGETQMIFTFTDTGIGMKPEFLDHIFDAFTRERDGRVDKTEGSGLGMAITQKIVELMSGTITVESQWEKGTRFTVSLPLRIEDQSMEQWEFPPLRILVADDDTIMCEYTIHLLEGLGIHATCVTSGEEALEQAITAHRHNRDFDAVIADWKMPGMDGLETMKKIREQVSRDVPVLIVSAYDWAEIEEPAIAAGVNGFLPKPLFPSTLMRGLNRYVLGRDPASGQRDRERRYDFTGSTILVVEDNELNREIAVELLTAVGARVEAACDGAQGVEAFSHSPLHSCDLILMDIQMPVMDGYTATRLIRELPREDAATVPILAMTADAFAEDIQAAREAGMDSHIAKPLDIAELKQTISRFL
ncbi:Sensory/regulatory protein RpfC [uncultured Clostridium sp.]|uniref:PAS domain-containing hybrid sensor histidine kinase/response regulator n=1 Tax=Enterocloster citroniae TaxID=358743 RepID=UPI000822E82E|nr:Sensory/regulatory protein RpfC [uncultured Clostridium sp.]